MIKLYTDAAVKGNPGPAGLGVLVVTENQQFQLSFPLEDNWTNHQAEFQALIYGLTWLIENNYTSELTFCYTDSQIVSQSIKKEYAKDVYFQNQLEEIVSLMKHFSFISVEWIPEAQNKGADNLARQALRRA